jgi:LysR family transcriptional repressor of citA
MDMQWLKTFAVTALHENFRRAAEQLYLAQPTVTMHIKHLEEKLGILLFERRGRSVYLTEAGNRFLPYAKQMIATLEASVHDLESWRQGFTRKLTIVVSPLIAVSMLPMILRQFIASYPDIEIVVDVMESIDINHAVAYGHGDVGLTRMFPNQPELKWRKLHDDPVVLVVPHDGRDMESALPFDIEQLLQQYLILTHNHPEYWDTLLTNIRLQYPHIRTMKVSQVHVTKRFIEEGLGISFLPRSTIVRERMEGRVLEVLTDDIVMPVASTYLIHQQNKEEVQLFMQFIGKFYH